MTTSNEITGNQDGAIYGIGGFKSEGDPVTDPPLSFGATTLSNDGNHYDLFVFKIGQSPMGIERNRISERLHIFPNPAVQEVCIEGCMPGQQVRVYSIFGTRLSDLEITQESKADISMLSGDMYILEYENEGRLRTTKLVVERH
jgi:hypothetical protein